MPRIPEWGWSIIDVINLHMFRYNDFQLKKVLSEMNTEISMAEFTVVNLPFLVPWWILSVYFRYFFFTDNIILPFLKRCVCLLKRHTGRGRSSICLVTSQMAIVVTTGPVQGQSQELPVPTGAQGHFSAALLGTLTGSWLKGRADRTQISKLLYIYLYSTSLMKTMESEGKAF